MPVDTLKVSVSVEAEDDAAEDDEAETLVVVGLGLHGPAMTASAARRATSAVAILLKEGIAIVNESLGRSKRVIACEGPRCSYCGGFRMPRRLLSTQSRRSPRPPRRPIRGHESARGDRDRQRARRIDCIS